MGDFARDREISAAHILRKQNPQGGQKLTMLSRLTHYDVRDDYSVRLAEGKDQVLENAVWADWDQRGRLVYARDGKIFTAAVGGDGLEQERELADFNDHKFAPREAPVWAKEW